MAQQVKNLPAKQEAHKEEDEHPYELLLTAETKKLVSVDGKTKGRAPTPSWQKQLQKG